MIKRNYFYSYVAFSEKGSPISACDGVLTTTSWFKKDCFMLTRNIISKAKTDNTEAADIRIFSLNRI